MKPYLIFFSLALAVNLPDAGAQIKLQDALKKAAGALNHGTPSQTEIGSALKEALQEGINAGTGRLSLENGFLGNAAVKLLFPPEAQKVEKTLRGLGLNNPCDDFIKSLNRAVELAVKEARPIFVSALQQMTLQDATNLLLSKEKNAATNYFKNATSSALQAKFSPVINNALSQTDATKYWTDLATRYNKLPMVAKVEPDLTTYATGKAIDGLFHEIAQEELKIRTNTGARSTALLQKVFGYADGK